MAKADWTIATTGSWAVTDAEYVSSGHSIKGVAGFSRFKYTQSILDVRVTAQVKIKAGYYPLTTDGAGMLARATSIVAPYNFYQATLRGYSGNSNIIVVDFIRYKAGAYTLLGGLYYSVYPAGSANSTWHQWRFSVTDELGLTALRMDYYHTGSSSWVNAYTYDDDSANRLTASGDAGFMLQVPSGLDNKIYMDDVSVIELTA
jgi:hypothetical protein